MLKEKRVLVTGGSGRLGCQLKSLIPKCLFPTHDEMDIQHPQKYLNQISSMDCLVHLAAITSVELCEQNNELAWSVNVEGTRNLVYQVLSKNSNCKIFYISTPCIFDGRKGDYSENDIPNPQNFYGLTKLVAETVVLENNGQVIRANFVERKAWSYSKAFIDRWGTYLYADTLAQKIVLEIERDSWQGILHICGDKKLSMFELAQKISPDVKPMQSSDYTGIASLTKDMTMISNKISAVKEIFHK